MILFKKISYKNFLATGNNPIEVNLDGHRSTLIVGTNGAGKSTIIEAIIFALFNKSFRKVNKNQLINSINGSDCLVEIEFQIGNVTWKVVRGMKPNIFEIYRNDNLLDQSSASIDQQKWLEQHVLKLNYKSFTQIVILGSSTFVPFMQLPAAHRREIIEDLLDIKIFSTMHVIVRDRIKTTSDEIKNLERDIDLIKEKVDIQKKFIDNLKKHSDKTIDQKQNKIEQLNAEVELNQDMINLYNFQIDKLKDDYSKLQNVDKKIKELETFKIKFGSKKKDHTNYKKFFEENDVCPQCNQEITGDIKHNHIEENTNQITKLEDALKKLEFEIEQTNLKLDEKNSILSEIQKYNNEINSALNNNRQVTKIIDEIQKEIVDIENNNNNMTDEKNKLNEYISDGVSISKRLSDIKTKKTNYDVLNNLLKDGGIKSQIIKKYLPVMNQLINKYLQSMDFYVNFTLDENFDETIKSRYRDDFTYASFSEGEKMRIDLSLMFTWRSIAKLKNSANTNLLILDEVFDSSLDISGTDDFMRIIKGLDEGTNVMVISHKGDSILDKFDRILKFDKYKNFSTVEEKF
jgi:DNA repair exonuclease SbcCD ATPase subunit